MLTYCVYAPLLIRIDALPLNVSYIVETVFRNDFCSLFRDIVSTNKIAIKQIISHL